MTSLNVTPPLQAANHAAFLLETEDARTSIMEANPTWNPCRVVLFRSQFRFRIDLTFQLKEGKWKEDLIFVLMAWIMR